MIGEVLRLRAVRPVSKTTALSDVAVALACAEGDPEAIAILFDRFCLPLSRYIRRLVDESAEVEDLVHATFVEVARGATAYDATRAGVSTWLFAIATNVVRRHRRATGRRNRLQRALASVAPATGADPAATADAKRTLERARLALQALPEPLREAFVLCELEGLSAKAAATVLSASEAAVWKRASRARALIRARVLGGTP